MSAAARARRLSEDADIIVLERGGEVSFANCGLPYFVGGEIEHEAQLLVQAPQSLKASLGIDVRTNTHVVSLDADRRVLTISDNSGLFELEYDELIFSPGGSETNSCDSDRRPRWLWATAVEQGDDHDVVVLSDGTRLVADIIVLSVGVRPDTQVWEEAGIVCERRSCALGS